MENTSAETWTEKYRPKTLNDVVHQEEVVTMLRRALGGKDLPHLLMYGPPGTGKTSAALAFCHELYPIQKEFKDRVLELNASDERGIAAVREKITFFSKRMIPSSSEKKLNVKIIILDEVDAMTRDAQSALRRVIEDCSKTTRFVLICNYISRLIAPIVSRCAKFRFKPLPREIQLSRLQTICSAESIDVTDEDMKVLIDRAEGDLRQAVCTLQSLVPILKYGDEKAKECFLKPTNDTSICKDVIKRISISKTEEIVEMAKQISKSCSGVSFVKKLFYELQNDDLINNENVVTIGKLVAESERRILNGCELQHNLLLILIALKKELPCC